VLALARVNSTVMRFPLLHNLLIAVVVIHLAGLVVFADLPAPAYPYVVSSKDGTHYFKMLPDPKNLFALDTHGRGVAYEVTKNGKDKTLWRVAGWYSFSTFISNDGKYLVRVGNWPPGEPSAQHLAVAFYDNGKLIKRYSPLDVLKDPAHAPRSVSHYRWLKDLNGFYKETEMFSFVTVENIEYTFDVTTGKLLFEEPVKTTGILLDVNLLLTTASHNKSSDASGGSVFRNLLGAAKGALIRAAASTTLAGFA
jgi:hypothetical protein